MDEFTEQAIREELEALGMDEDSIEEAIAAQKDAEDG